MVSAVAVTVVAVLVAALAAMAVVKLRRAGARKQEARSVGLHLRALKAANKAVNRSGGLPPSAGGTVPARGHIKVVRRGDDLGTPPADGDVQTPVAAPVEAPPASLAVEEPPASLAGGEAPA